MLEGRALTGEMVIGMRAGEVVVVEKIGVEVVVVERIGVEVAGKTDVEEAVVEETVEVVIDVVEEEVVVVEHLSVFSIQMLFLPFKPRDPLNDEH